MVKVEKEKTYKVMITLENEDEVRALWHIMNHCPNEFYYSLADYVTNFDEIRSIKNSVWRLLEDIVVEDDIKV